MKITTFCFLILILLEKTQTQNCIGYDQATQLCKECDAKYYLYPSISSKSSVNQTSDCFLKSISDVLYYKKIYISNQTCFNSTLCLGTKDFPYDNLIKAFINIHNVDIAEKFLEQRIEIYLLGNPHYILASDLPYSNVRFFRRMNATIKIGPAFCEDEYVIGCIFGFRKEKVDVYIKSTNFIFEVYRNLTIYNLNLYGNDIVLSSNTFQSCFYNKSICCNAELYQMDSQSNECGLINKSINLNEKSKLASISSLFQLRMFYNFEMTQNVNLNECPIPFLNLTNINFQYFYSLQGEFSWFSFVMYNNLGYNVSFSNIILNNNFFPYGYLISFSLEDDPYYNFLSTDIIKSLYLKYPNSNLYINSISFYAITIILTDSYDFQITQGYSGSFAPGLINIFNEQNKIAQYFFDNIKLSGLILFDSFYFFSYILSNTNNALPKIVINNSLIQNNTNLSFLNCENLNISIYSTFISYSPPGYNPFFNLFNYGSFLINGCTFSNLQLSSSQIFFYSNNYIMNMINFNLFNLLDNFAIIQSGELNLRNSTFFGFNQPFSNNIFSFTDSNLRLERVSIINANFTTINAFMFYLSVTMSIILEISNFDVENITVYTLFSLVSSFNLANISLKNSTFYLINGVYNGRWDHFFLLDCLVGSFNELIVENLEGINVNNFLIVICLSTFQTVKFLNIYLDTVNYLHYYCFIMETTEITYKGLTTTINLSNITIQNVLFNRSIDLFFLGLIGNIVISQCSFKNLTFTQSVFQSASRNQLFYLHDFNSLIFLNSNAEYYEKTFMIFFLTLQAIDYVLIDSSIFQGHCTPDLNRVPAVSIKFFLNFTFSNNSILNMSAKSTQMDISDETGVISLLPSGSYYLSILTPSFVKIYNNFFFGNTGNKYGIVGVIGCTHTEIYNNSFNMSNSYYGGAFAFYAVASVYINNLIVNNLNAFQGGVLYFASLTQELVLNNSFFKNLSASYGAGIYFSSISNIIIQNLNIQNSNSTQSGGAIFFTSANNVTIQNIFSSNTYASIGGLFYIELSFVILNGVQCVLSQSSQTGGAIHIISSTSYLLLQNAAFIYCSSVSDGAILYSLNIGNLTIIDTSFLYSLTKNTGYGIINFSGYYIIKEGESPHYGTFDLRNIICMHNIADLGGCLYYSSNNYLTLENFSINNISGSIFNIESDSSISLLFQNISIHKCNYFSYEQQFQGVDLTSPLMVFLNSIILFSNFIVQDNTAVSNLIKISTAIIQIENSNFSNFFNTYQFTTVLSRFFYISDSSLEINNSNFFYSNLSLIPCMIFEIRSSIIFIYQSSFQNSHTLDISIINALDSKIYFKEIEFINLAGTLGVLSLKTTSITINECIFKNNTNSLQFISDDQATDINFADDQLADDNITIINSIFYHSDKNSLVIKKASNISIHNSHFYSMGVFNNNSFSRGIYIDVANYINFISCTFHNFFSEIGGVMIFYQKSINDLLTAIEIFNCSFYNNRAYFGGVIYLRGSIFLKINSSNFSENRAEISTTYTSKVTIDDSGKGGCILSDCEYFPSYIMELTNSVFTNNSAQKFGPIIISKSSSNKSITNFKNIFVNNSDSLNFTNKITGSPLHAYLLSSNFFLDICENLSNILSNADKTNKIMKDYEINFAEIASGQEFNFTVILTDFDEQLLLFESKSSAELTCVYYNLTENVNKSNHNNNTNINYTDKTQYAQNVFVDKGISQSFNGIFTFSGTRIVISPNKNLSCLITVSTGDSIFFKSTLEMGQNGKLNRIIQIPWSIYVRNCIIGEVLMEDFTCFECLPGSYLYADPMVQSDASKKCNNCPDNAYCKGGKYISPLAGYWRFSERTALILECPTPESCMGIGEDFGHLMDFSQLNELDFISGVCNPNYWGNLCYTCRKNFGRFKTNQNCEECSSLYLIYIKMALSLVFIITYIAVQAKIFSTIDKKDPGLAIMLKLLLNHFQTISMINLVDLGWTVEFNFYFSFLEYLSFLSQDFFIIDCLVQDIDQNLLVQKIIFTILLPIILSLLMITIWIISFAILIYRKNKNADSNNKFLVFITEKMRITLLILVFILYPEILRKCFTLLNCLLIDDSDDFKVLTASPSVRCWDRDHTTWVLTVSLPGLIVWGAFTPSLILFILYRYKFRIQNFIIETHRSYAKNNIVHNKKGQLLIQKNIFIDIEPLIKEKIFPKDTRFPVTNEIKYKRNNQLFLEIIEVQVKNKIEILEEMKIPSKEIPENLKAFAKSTDLDIINEDKIINDPSIFLEYLAFLDDLKGKTLADNELNNLFVRVREEFSLSEKKAEDNQEVSNQIVPKPNSELNTNNEESNQATTMPMTYLVIKNLGFIYRGYRPEFYFWETVMFSRKFLLIFIGVFTEFFPKKTKPTMLIIILVGYIYVQIKFRPYQFTYLNKLEAYSLVVAFLTGNIGILLFSDFMQSFAPFFLFLIFGINAFYFSIWIKCFFQYGNLKEKMANFLKYLYFIKRKFIKVCFG